MTMADRRLELDELTPGTVVTLFYDDGYATDICEKGVIKYTETAVYLKDENGKIVFSDESKMYVGIEMLSTKRMWFFPIGLYGKTWYCTAKE